MKPNELRRICWKIVEFSKEFKKYHSGSTHDFDLYPFEELADKLEDELIRLLNEESEE